MLTLRVSSFSWRAELLIAVSIQESFPCKSISTGHDSVNVEMDPQSEVEVIEKIKSLVAAPL